MSQILQRYLTLDAHQLLGVVPPNTRMRHCLETLDAHDWSKRKIVEPQNGRG